MTNVVVGIQMLTFLALAILFFRGGLWPLGVAQLAYLVATAALFLNKS